jgi:hypothetical protein
MASDELGAFLTRETGRRALVTLGALCLYRLGCQIPLPSLNFDVLTHAPRPFGAALGHLSIFAVGVTPIFSALFLVEIARLGFPGLGRRDAGDEEGTPGLRRTVQILALIIAAFQGYGVARGIEGVEDFVETPGATFEATVAATFVAATALLGWLGDRITARGVGPGFWILLAAPVVARLPSAAITIWELERVGATDSSTLPIVLVFIVAASAAIVVLAKAHAPDGASGDASIDVWPPLLAQAVPALIIGPAAAILHVSSGPLLIIGAPLHILLVAVLIGLFTLLRASARARSAAGVDRPVWQTAAAQIAICSGGEVLARVLELPFTIDGAWLIVIVTTALSAMSAARARQFHSKP